MKRVQESGRVWKVVEDSGRKWKKVDDGGREWKIVEESERLRKRAFHGAWSSILHLLVFG